MRFYTFYIDNNNSISVVTSIMIISIVFTLNPYFPQEDIVFFPSYQSRVATLAIFPLLLLLFRIVDKY